eukprot:4854199-Amphidinium_carterae.2
MGHFEPEYLGDRGHVAVPLVTSMAPKGKLYYSTSLSRKYSYHGLAMALEPNSSWAGAGQLSEYTPFLM